MESPSPSSHGDEASATRGQEVTHMFHEVRSHDDLLLPVRGSKRLKYTCIACSRRYIALGSSHGGLYIFQRDTLKYLQQIGNKEGITRALFSPDENVIGLATSGGAVIVWRLNVSSRNKAERLVAMVAHRSCQVTSLCWDNAGLRLFSADDRGRIIATNTDSNKPSGIFKLQSELVVTVDSSVVQMDFAEERLLISTMSKCCLCEPKKQMSFQIGTKPRDGAYGACFMKKPGNEKPSIYCARPGSRMWEANFLCQVQSTHQFKHLLATPPLPVIGKEREVTLPSEEAKHPPQSLAFPVLHPIGHHFLVTWSGRGVYVFDPIHVKVVFWTNDISDLTDVCVSKTSLYCLHADGHIRKYTLQDISHCATTLYQQGTLIQSARLVVHYQSQILRARSRHRLSSKTLHELAERVASEDSILGCEVEDVALAMESRMLDVSSITSSRRSSFDSLDGMRTQSGIYVVRKRLDSSECDDLPLGYDAQMEQLQQPQEDSTHAAIVEDASCDTREGDSSENKIVDASDIVKESEVEITDIPLDDSPQDIIEAAGQDIPKTNQDSYSVQVSTDCSVELQSENKIESRGDAQYLSSVLTEDSVSENKITSGAQDKQDTTLSRVFPNSVDISVDVRVELQSENKMAATADVGQSTGESLESDVKEACARIVVKDLAFLETNKDQICHQLAKEMPSSSKDRTAEQTQDSAVGSSDQQANDATQIFASQTTDDSVELRTIDSIGVTENDTGTVSNEQDKETDITEKYGDLNSNRKAENDGSENTLISLCETAVTSSGIDTTDSQGVVNGNLCIPGDDEVDANGNEPLQTHLGIALEEQGQIVSIIKEDSSVCRDSSIEHLEKHTELDQSKGSLDFEVFDDADRKLSADMEVEVEDGGLEVQVKVVHVAMMSSVDTSESDAVVISADREAEASNEAHFGTNTQDDVLSESIDPHTRDFGDGNLTAFNDVSGFGVDVSGFGIDPSEKTSDSVFDKSSDASLDPNSIFVQASTVLKSNVDKGSFGNGTSNQTIINGIDDRPKDNREGLSSHLKAGVDDQFPTSVSSSGTGLEATGLMGDINPVLQGPTATSTVSDSYKTANAETACTRVEDSAVRVALAEDTVPFPTDTSGNPEDNKPSVSEAWEKSSGKDVLLCATNTPVDLTSTVQVLDSAPSEDTIIVENDEMLVVEEDLNAEFPDAEVGLDQLQTRSRKSKAGSELGELEKITLEGELKEEVKMGTSSRRKRPKSRVVDITATVTNGSVQSPASPSHHSSHPNPSPLKRSHSSPSHQLKRGTPSCNSPVTSHYPAPVSPKMDGSRTPTVPYHLSRDPSKTYPSRTSSSLYTQSTSSSHLAIAAATGIPQAAALVDAHLLLSSQVNLKAVKDSLSSKLNKTKTFLQSMSDSNPLSPREGDNNAPLFHPSPSSTPPHGSPVHRSRLPSSSSAPSLQRVGDSPHASHDQEETTLGSHDQRSIPLMSRDAAGESPKLLEVTEDEQVCQQLNRKLAAVTNITITALKNPSTSYDIKRTREVLHPWVAELEQTYRAHKTQQREVVKQGFLLPQLVNVDVRRLAMLCFSLDIYANEAGISGKGESERETSEAGSQGTTELDQQRAEFIERHYFFLDSSRVLDILSHKQGNCHHAVESLLDCVFAECDSDVKEGLESGQARLTFDLLMKSNISSSNLPMSLSCIRRLFMVDSNVALEMLVCSYPHIAPWCAWHILQPQSDSTLFLKYVQSFLATHSQSERNEFLTQLVAREQLVTSLAEAALTFDPPSHVDLFCECGKLPRPGSHKIKWSHDEILHLLLGSPSIPSSAFQRLLSEAGHWRGLLDIMRRSRTETRMDALRICLQLDDASLLEQYEDFHPAKEEEWRVVLQWMDKSSTAVNTSGCSDRKRCIECGEEVIPCCLRDSSASAEAPESHQPTGFYSIVDDGTVCSKPECDWSHDQSSDRIGKSDRLRDEQSAHSVSVIQAESSQNPESTEPRVDHPGDCLDRSILAKGYISMIDPSKATLQTPERGVPSVRESNWVPTVTWQRIASLLVSRLGAMKGIILLKEVNIPEGCLSRDFYQMCILLSIWEKRQSTLSHAMLEGTDSYLWSKRQPLLGPKLQFAVQKECKNHIKKNDAVRMHSLFTQQQLYIEDPRTHWGRRIQLTRYCLVCKQVIARSVDQQSAWLVFPCGHAFHDACVPEKACMICFYSSKK